MVRVRQSFDSQRLDDIGGELSRALSSTRMLERLRAGERIAVTAGSRGIAEYPRLLRSLVTEIERAGAHPFVVPAMGSHGGATAEGQIKLLEELGVTEESVGAPILAGMEVVLLGHAQPELPVSIDRHAHEADGIVLFNRIKPHVAFRGRYESGLMKMIAIGLGNQAGADRCHRLGFGRMADNIERIARFALQHSRIRFGVGVIENAYHQPCRIEVLGSEEIPEREPELLEEAWRRAPRLCFDALDVLVIDEIGKNISGTGFDNNVVGRYHTDCASGGPAITRIAALDLTSESRGNANGLGILDFTTRRAYDKFDFEQTYPNSLTSTIPVSVKIPMVLKNDLQAIQAAIKTCQIEDRQSVRMVRIKNTLSLGEIEVSESLVGAVAATPGLTVLGPARELAFDAKGDLF